MLNMTTLPLPSRVAPSARSRSAGRLGVEESGDRTRAHSALPSTPRMPLSRSIYPEVVRPSRDKPDTTRTNSSSTTSTTSSSSFLDRMNVPSSRTSFEDEQLESSRQGGGWATYRGKKAVQTEDEQSNEEDRNKGPTALIAGHGADVWSRVTAVASKLTVNVSQAWQNSILVDGEETPPGEESRLTKAMKAYHLDRTRSAADLPPWLFTEQERGVASKAWNVSQPKEYEDRFLPDRAPEFPQRSGLREVYDMAAAASSSVLPATRRPPADSGDGGGSRAANRLKAIRDARRSAKTASEPAQLHSEDRSDRRHAGGKDSGARQIGLPPRPGGSRRH